MASGSGAHVRSPDACSPALPGARALADTVGAAAGTACPRCRLTQPKCCCLCRSCCSGCSPLPGPPRPRPRASRYPTHPDRSGTRPRDTPPPTCGGPATLQRLPHSGAGRRQPQGLDRADASEQERRGQPASRRLPRSASMHAARMRPGIYGPRPAHQRSDATICCNVAGWLALTVLPQPLHGPEQAAQGCVCQPAGRREGTPGGSARPAPPPYVPQPGGQNPVACACVATPLQRPLCSRSRPASCRQGRGAACAPCSQAPPVVQQAGVGSRILLVVGLAVDASPGEQVGVVVGACTQARAALGGVAAMTGGWGSIAGRCTAVVFGGSIASDMHHAPAWRPAPALWRNPGKTGTQLELLCAASSIAARQVSNAEQQGTPRAPHPPRFGRTDIKHRAAAQSGTKKNRTLHCVVVHDVHNDLNAGLVESLHHLLELPGSRQRAGAVCGASRGRVGPGRLKKGVRMRPPPFPRRLPRLQHAARCSTDYSTPATTSAPQTQPPQPATDGAPDPKRLMGAKKLRWE